MPSTETPRLASANHRRKQGPHEASKRVTARPRLKPWGDCKSREFWPSCTRPEKGEGPLWMVISNCLEQGPGLRDALVGERYVHFTAFASLCCTPRGYTLPFCFVLCFVVSFAVLPIASLCFYYRRCARSLPTGVDVPPFISRHVSLRGFLLSRTKPRGHFGNLPVFLKHEWDLSNPFMCNAADDVGTRSVCRDVLRVLDDRGGIRGLPEPNKGLLSSFEEIPQISAGTRSLSNRTRGLRTQPTRSHPVCIHLVCKPWIQNCEANRSLAGSTAPSLSLRLLRFHAKRRLDQAGYAAHHRTAWARLGPT